MAEQMTLRGTLQGHGGWVTQIATTPQYPDMVLSSSRGILIFNFFSFYYNTQYTSMDCNKTCTGNLCIHRAYIMLSSIRNACDCRRFHYVQIQLQAQNQSTGACVESKICSLDLKILQGRTPTTPVTSTAIYPVKMSIED